MVKLSKQTMKDVSHRPPTGATVTNVWDRGRKPGRAMVRND
ncbi:MAG: hypothetical protein ACQETI_03475 [Halobacteriota archaeon]